MLAAVSPSASCHNETLNTLRFANQAKNIVNVPKINEVRNRMFIIGDRRGGGGGVGSTNKIISCHSTRWYTQLPQESIFYCIYIFRGRATSGK